MMSIFPNPDPGSEQKAPSKANASTHIQALRQLFASSDLRSQFGWLGLSAFLSNILALAVPLAILQILDRVVINQSVQTLVLLVVGVIVALLLEVVLRETSGLTTGWLGARFELAASVNALEHLVHVPLQRFEKEEPGTHVERVLASAKVADFYSGNALLVLFDLPFSFVFLILISLIGGWLVLVPILIAAFFSVLVFQSGRWMQRQVFARDVLDDRRLGFLTEVLSGIHSVKTLMLESLMLRRYERLQKSNSELNETLAIGEASANNMSVVFGQVMIISVIFVGSMIVMSGGMTPGGLAACMLLSVRTLQPLRRGLAVWMRYQTFVAANDRLNSVMDTPRESDTGKLKVEPIQHGMELRDITVTFDNGKVLFSNLNLIVKAGELIAIQGESGSGKTSLLTLMNGMLRPTKGSVWVDGQTLESFSFDSVYQQVALLPQSGSIIAGTILENLTMFDDRLNDDALHLASQLGLDRFVSSMKMGYETPLGEGVSDTIPMGLKQVIIIARALVRKPSVILFDEANSSLDIQNDQLLRNYLAQLKGTCTIVLVTPRPSLVSLADKIYTLKNGVLDDGPASNDGRLTDATLTGPIPPHPNVVNDLAVVIQRQFSQESDISICLQPLLQALKWNGHARELSQAMPHLASTLDVSNLCSIMANLGLMPKHLKGNLARLHPRLMPCLFVPPTDSAKLVLEVLPDGSLRIFDCISRTEKNITPASVNGEIYLFQTEETKLKVTNLPKSWVQSLLWRMRRHIALVFALSITGAVLSLGTPLYVRFIYDTVLPSGDSVMAAYMSLGVITVMGVDYLFKTLKGRILAFVAGRSDYILGNGMFQRVIGLPTSLNQGASVSHQVGRLRNLVRLRDFIIGPMSIVAFEIPSTLILLITVGVINPYVLAVLLLSALAFSALGFWSHKSSERSGQKVSKFQNQRWEFLNETLTDMRTIRMSGAAPVWLERFRELSGKSIMASFHDRQLQARTNGLAQVLGSVTGLLGLATSAYLAINGTISSGTMLATMIILWRVTGPMENLVRASTALTQGLDNIAQTDRLMRLKSESDTGVVQTLRGPAKGELSFNRVSFRYLNDADPVLLGVSFEVKSGQMIVLTGGVGSGKSTVLKLIERNYSPQAGTIRLDGIDIRQLTASDLRTNLGYMPQNCEIFYGSVAQNLLLVHPSASDAELQWAVEMAGLSTDVNMLAEGMRTRISNSKANQLPHGFMQRLSLARVMLKPAPLVLLDEPGAGMDMIGEAALLRCLEWLHGKSTVIMVSHRPGHMKLANTVIVMQQGTIIASGPFDSVKDKIL
jgi:ATP-binding cassette subfamily B protein